MTYQEEQNLLLESYFERYNLHSRSVEFFISARCDQNCEYCYLHNYQRLLYPSDVDNKEHIIKNLKILLNYFKKIDYDFSEYDVFTGEFFALPYWEEIMQIFCDFNIDIGRPRRFMTIPSNASFLFDDKKTERVEYWIEKLETEANIFVFISGSVDGPTEVEQEERPGVKIKTDEYYDKMFKFFKKHGFCFHPMVSKGFLKNYKENYDWWIDNIIKYNILTYKNGIYVYSIPMFLEVRNEDQWDDETLENYKKFLWYVAEKDIKDLHHGDLKEFALRVSNGYTPLIEDGLGAYNTVQPYILSIPELQNKVPCGIQKGPVIRLGDLALIPCHRTGYDNLVYGHFKVDENDEIVGLEANNTTLAFKIKFLNPTRSFLTCSDCSIAPFCLKGCMGAQYEANHELFSTIPEVCKMFKTKYKTLHEIAEHYQVYDIVKTILGVSNERKEELEYVRKYFGKL